MKKIFLAGVTLFCALNLAACSSNQSRNKTASSKNRTAKVTKKAKSKKESTASSNSSSKTSQQSSQSSNDKNKKVSLNQLASKQVAAGVLYLGSKSNEAWKNMIDANGHITIEYTLNDSDLLKHYSEPGNGTSYEFLVNDMTAGMINNYVISNDQQTIYCYSQQEHNSAIRNVKPFAVLQTRELVELYQGNNAEKVTKIANRVTKIAENK